MTQPDPAGYTLPLVNVTAETDFFFYIYYIGKTILKLNSLYWKLKFSWTKLVCFSIEELSHLYTQGVLWNSCIFWKVHLLWNKLSKLNEIWVRREDNINNQYLKRNFLFWFKSEHNVGSKVGFSPPPPTDTKWRWHVLAGCLRCYIKLLSVKEVISWSKLTYYQSGIDFFSFGKCVNVQSIAHYRAHVNPALWSSLKNHFLMQKDPHPPNLWPFSNMCIEMYWMKVIWF